MALRLHAILLVPGAVLCAAFVATGASDRTNPLVMTMPDGTRVENCADPTVIQGQQSGDTSWYLYCTKDPLYDEDKDVSGNWRFHLIPIFRSDDLVHWTWAADAFATVPAWVEPSAGLWAPEIQFFGGKYYLYYSATNTKASVSGATGCADDSAIGVATSNTPTGPFTDRGTPAVYPRRSGIGCSFYLTIDPDVITDTGGQKWIYYGNFNGGVEVRKLSSNGFSSLPETTAAVALPDRCEAPEVVFHDGFYYLFHSVSDCCRGPLSGYAVFVGRSTSPAGPFLDREGVSLLDARTGGTPVLAFSGDRWVGPGHNTVLTDHAGQDWTIYHAIDADEPYFDGSVGFTKRPPFLDPLDWVNGWPVVRGGWWLSQCAQPGPVAQAGGAPSYAVTRRQGDSPGAVIATASDEFDGPELGPQWSWIRPPAAGSTGLTGGTLRFDTQARDLYEDRDDASVLVETAPPGDFMVETLVRHTMPASGCCQNFTQAGLVLYGDDDNYLKLVHVSIGGTRQIEFAKEWASVPAGYPRYGGTRVGPPAEWTWLRIVRRGVYRGERYTSYSSRDGATWTRGPTWAHALGPQPKIGLVSMSGAGFSAYFDYVHVHALAPDDCADPAHADPCDRDGDAVGDACDDDDDGDLLGDLADCDARDPAQGRPAEVSGLALSGRDPTILIWEAAPRADRYDVTRGLLSGLTSSDYGACLADDRVETTLEDASQPAPDEGFTYLIRGADLGCGGSGSWGTAGGAAGAGGERVNVNPEECP